MTYDGPDMEPIPTTSLSARSFVPTHDRFGLPIFRAGNHVKIIIEEGGERHEFGMPAAEAHHFAQLIHKLADGEDLKFNNPGSNVGGLGRHQPK